MKGNTFHCFFVLLLFSVLSFVNSSTTEKAPFMRHGTCRPHKTMDDEVVKKYGPNITPQLNEHKPKGYLGTVGILGGSVGGTGPAYFTAMAALRVGADAVHIICTKAVGSALQSMAADIAVHPLIDVSHDKLMKIIGNMDVVVIGPGMDKEYGSSPAVIHRVIDHCKLNKKPMVLDLDPMFLTAATLAHLQNYPPPGFIMTMNTEEFETFYKLIKSPQASSEAYIDVDFTKLGDNVLIHRKGCTDTAFSKDTNSSWSYSGISSPRRTGGQGDIIAGVTAVYFNWAINTLAEDSKRIGAPMLPAAAASYRAAKLMRVINNNVYMEKNIGTVTSDMLNEIPDVLYGMNPLIDQN